MLRWRFASPESFSWRHWGEVHYAFDERSYQTHFLNETAFAVLNALAEGAETEIDVYQALLEKYTIESDSELAEAIGSALTVLDSLGVIEKVGA